MLRWLATCAVTIGCLATAGRGGVVNEDFKLLASDGASWDYFGHSVSIDGDRAVIGAVNDDVGDIDSGSAYVFRFDGSGWTQEAKLIPSDWSPHDWFGWTVSISGDTAVVGTPFDDGNTGSVYVFRFNGSQWIEETKLLASDGEAGDGFGWSVSISGDRVLIGTQYDDDNGPWSGAAYVFRFDGSGWFEEAKLLASDGAAHDRLGYSVSIEGDKAVIGAHYDDDNGDYSGSVYVFHFDGSGWTQEAKLIAADGMEWDEFGSSVSLSDNRVVIAAWGDEGNDPYTDPGSAYVFRFDGSGWTQEAKLLASDGADDDQFGCSVSISGDRAVIGARRDDDNGSSTGSAYIFRLNGSQWTQESKLLASDGAEYDIFGGSVSISGNTTLIGAFGDDGNNPFSDFGSAYIYTIAATGACCVGSDCEAMTELECSKIDGEYQGDGTVCNDHSCYAPPVTGACCTCNELSCVIATAEDCKYFGLTWLGEGTTCEDNPCPTSCPGDINADGVVNVQDILLLIAAWGSCP